MLLLILPLIISIIDYFTEGLFIRTSELKEKFISFAAGVSITYLLLELLPTIYRKAFELNYYIIIAVLIGFISHHLVEKYIYQHVPRRKLAKDLKIEHLIFLYAYHFIAGMVIVTLANRGILLSILFFIPILLHIIIDTLPQDILIKRKLAKIFFSSSTFTGGIIAFYFNPQEIFEYVLLGVISGILLYFVVRESIPTDRKGSPFYFVLGVISYGALIIGMY